MVGTRPTAAPARSGASARLSSAIERIVFICGLQFREADTGHVKYLAPSDAGRRIPGDGFPFDAGTLSPRCRSTSTSA